MSEIPKQVTLSREQIKRIIAAATNEAVSAFHWEEGIDYGVIYSRVAEICAEHEHAWVVEGDGNYEAFRTVCEICGEQGAFGDGTDL